MPFILNKKLSSTHVVVWEIDNDIKAMRDRLNLSQNEQNHVDSMKPFRRKEWLSKKFVLNTLLEREVEIIKDKYGKPFIAGHDQFISISHSKDMLAVILSEQKVGIDIQREESKIQKIAQKFLFESQISDIEKSVYLDTLHYYWGAKESMYKAYGKKGIDFRKHLLVENIDSQKSTGNARLLKKELHIDYQIFYEKIKNYYLVYAIEIT